MENYLVHHGILGQKWGVRRYQNKDGSLTEAGKKRYKADGSLTYEEARLRSSSDKKEQDAYYNKLRSEIDTRNLKGSEKAQREKEILEDWNNPDASIRALDRAVELQKKIDRESGNWYWGKGVSEGFKKALGEMHDLDEEYDFSLSRWDLDSDYRKKRDVISQELLGTVLKDIGYNDTPENRRLIESMVFID